MSASAVASSTADRPLAMRMRRDLVLVAQQLGGKRVWAVKDPISLKYFHLQEAERAVLAGLDGRISLEQLRRQLDELLAPRHISITQIYGFLARLHKQGLVVSDAFAQGEQLLARDQETKRKRRWQSLANLLAFRTRGINPRWLLDRLAPVGSALFSPLAVCLTLLLAMTAGLLVTAQSETFFQKLPDASAVLAASNLPWLLLVLAVTKILHELGHGLACRYFGGNCHELGLMLLVGTPTLYCNVSDSWMLSSKWQRMAIAAAGMYVELIVASLCTLLWWFSQPGLFNSLCLNAMLICSLGTLLINGNPLLKYDGYFILSDLVEVPNLAEESRQVVRRFAAQGLLGYISPDAEPISGRRAAWLAMYSIASTVYRYVVVVGVLWALFLLAANYDLEVLIGPLVLVVAAGLIGPPLVQGFQFMREPSPGRRAAPARVALVSLLAILGLLAFLYLPLSRHVSAPVVLDFRDAKAIYVTVPGALIEQTKEGEQVAAGQVVARLANLDLNHEIAKLTTQRDVKRLHLANLKAGQLQGTQGGAAIPAAAAALADADAQLKQVKHEAEQLTITTPVAGTVLPPPPSSADAPARDKLPRRNGSPLEERNLNSYLETGTLVALVGNPKNCEAILHVDQRDIAAVEVGQSSRIKLDSFPGATLHGKVVEIAKRDLQSMPPELAAAGRMAARENTKDKNATVDTWYQVRVEFNSADVPLVGRGQGTARIDVASESLADQLARFLRQTFRR